MSRRTVEILEANETLLRIMSQVLREVGVAVVERSGDETAPAELCDALIVDVDSGTRDTAVRAAAYLEDDRAVLFTGLRGSRENYADSRWVDRPFTPTAFLTECVDTLGLSAEDVAAGVDARDGDSETDSDDAAGDQDAEPETGEVPPLPPVDLDLDEDEPITRELAYDEAQDLERRLGLEPGMLGTSKSETTVSDEESFEVLDLDDSGIIVSELDELQFALGGKIAGKINARRIDEDELVEGREAEPRARQTRRPTFNQTMPDTPTALGSDVDDTKDTRVPSDVGSVPGPPVDERTSSGPHRVEGLVDESSGLRLPPGMTNKELAAQIKGVARMLAESWQRIALTSRTEDRADRIERVLIAAVGTGMRGAAEELQRVPPASGFAGALSSLTFIDTIRTIRDRRLRGRLEVALGDDAYVLHMDGLYLEEIETLSGNVDGMLLDILHQGGALDDRTYEELSGAFESGLFMGPVEMELGRQQVVSDVTLQSARVVRARELFRRLCGTRGGQFAFLEIRPGDGQAWPVDPLRINVDQLILELLRESSIDTGDSRATARTRLVLDPNRAASLEQSRLTDEERDVMMFFREGETLESARERLQQAAGPEEVDRIVDRLKKVELLKRSDPVIPVEPEVEKAQTRTVVSDVSDVISIEERERAEGPEESSGADASLETEATTRLEPSWDTDLPDPLDTGVVDALVEEAIAAYESEASEASERAEAESDADEDD